MPADRPVLVWTREAPTCVRAYLDYHHKVESAPRRRCPECQYESNEYHESHQRECARFAWSAPIPLSKEAT